MIACLELHHNGIAEKKKVAEKEILYGMRPANGQTGGSFLDDFEKQMSECVHVGCNMDPEDTGVQLMKSLQIGEIALSAFEGQVKSFSYDDVREQTIKSFYSMKANRGGFARDGGLRDKDLTNK